MPNFIEVAGRRIAYDLHKGRTPTVVFLGGLRSDMTGTKASFLADWARQHGQAYLRLDYSGHGASSGRFADGRIGDWLADALAVIEAASSGPVVLVGSSLGGWIALLVARHLSERVRGLLLIAPAPDFTERLIWNALTGEERARLEREGHLTLPAGGEGEEPLAISYPFIVEARAHLVLKGYNPVPIHVPVRILHGMRDKDVPWELSFELMERLLAKDVALTLVREGDHRLSSPGELRRLRATLEELLETVAADNREQPGSDRA